MSIAKIAAATGLMQRQVQYAIFAESRPQAHRAGRPPVLPTAIIEMIKSFITTPTGSRRTMPWNELREHIPALVPWSDRALLMAMGSNGVQRLLQPVQIPLSQKTRQKRLEFALR